MSERAAGDVILCLNSGSSSLKFALFTAEADGPRRISEGAVEGIGDAHGHAWLSGAGRVERSGAFLDHDIALQTALSLLEESGTPTPTVAGHRIVHGGLRFVDPVRVDEDVLTRLRRLTPLAPLHMPAAIRGIIALAARRPDIPHVACFDTAFHAAMPEHARRLPLPDRFDLAGVRRYGFHGLSYEFVMSTLGARPPSRVVIAHLGNGASLVAVKNGQAVDTTMGFTPTGGVLMGTRSGDLDPGALIYLQRETGLSVDALERLVNGESGLTAIGGVADMRTLLARAPTSHRARLAVTMFGYGVRKAIASLAAALDGIDLLVFTGGIGENAPDVRAEACRGLEFMGVELDTARNGRGDGIISAASSRCSARVVATNEDLVIARHTLRVVRSEPSAA